MQIPDLLLPQPCFDLTPEKQSIFESLFNATPYGGVIDYRLSIPKWQFLSYLCRNKDLVMHGSQNTDIDIVEPMKAGDVRAFSSQEAIYATTDGIWVIFFAIIDRKKFLPSLFNSCLCIRTSPDRATGPLYFFSMTHSVLVQNPWCDGVIYLLPRGDFEREPAREFSGAEIIFPHWISFKPARPVARLPVHPQDFPFLDQIHGHDDEKLVRLSTEDPNGFPWPAALET